MKLSSKWYLCDLIRPVNCDEDDEVVGYDYDAETDEYVPITDTSYRLNGFTITDRP
jgi:hypothetical protein